MPLREFGLLARVANVSLISLQRQHGLDQLPTIDGKFRAFDSRTGKELWVVDQNADANSIPITYLGKDGKQYVGIFASGGEHKELVTGRLFVYGLP